jgi:hypothetical protein
MVFIKDAKKEFLDQIANKVILFFLNENEFFMT